jgi:hypothetical protein
MCTIHLEELCRKRAWWFSAFRETLATGVRLFALILFVRTGSFQSRSPMCRKCIRFKKNVLKRVSPVFNRLDGSLNPLFNRVRDSLLTAEELDVARLLAHCATEKQFIRPSDLTTLSESH